MNIRPMGAELFHADRRFLAILRKSEECYSFFVSCTFKAYAVRNGIGKVRKSE